jgi:inner membrane protein
LDNITHTLFGATLARTPIGRAGRGATAALLLASNAPDIDIVTTSGGALSYLEWHRGPTHGPLGLVGLGLATAGLVFLGRAVLDRWRAPEAGARADGNASYAALALVSMLGILLHVLMDLPTSYGSRLLSPFDWHWYAFDWMPIIDIYLLAALTTGLVSGQRWPGTRRRNAIIVIAFMAANYGVRAASHERAVSLAPRVFGAALPARCDAAPLRGLLDRWPRADIEPPVSYSSRCLAEIAALPDFGTPFRWRLIAKLSNAYLVRDVNLLDASMHTPPVTGEAPWRLAVSTPNEWTPQVFQAATTREARVFLGFSRFPAVRTHADAAGVTTVSWVDMRFTAPRPDPQRTFEPDRERRAPNLFGATVRIGPDGQVIGSQLGIGN